ncbi:LIM and SH3 domain protein Lasp isoform X2 [Haemaphysalis longicornis]
MSSKKCARCEKTVYPLEELKCLDKIWHKGCFKCQECNMTLNMKTYKGFNKLPYCSAHCPQAKHTAVADTPEAKRLAENTRIQSQVKYHEDFEKLKGKVTQVADDPETMRIRQTSKIISNVAYHGELERKNLMEQRRGLLPPDRNGHNDYPAEKRPPRPGIEPVASPTPAADHFAIEQPRLVGAHYGADQEIAYDSAQFPAPPPPPPPPNEDRPGRTHASRMGTEYDIPANNNSPYSSKLQSTVIYTSEEGPVQTQPVRKVGSIADYDPLNDNYGSSAVGYNPPQAQAYYRDAAPAMQRVMPSQPQMPSGRTFRAMYDYVAQDVDEVSFLDGDMIVSCVPIDEGWMTGTVQRTGSTGMLPANYVEPVN